jgi:3-methyladenine DNA glycosylase AlkD
MNAENVKKDLRNLADFEKANILQRFFKTKKGEYGEGDIFLGIIVPNTRKVAKRYINLELYEIKELLYSKIHEERLCALLILVQKFECLNNRKDPNKFSSERKLERARKNIFEFYIKNAKQANNWDLVDLSAPKIIGQYLLNKPRDILYKFAESKNLWEKRISIISTFTFIKNNQFEDTFKIAEILMNDRHDLIHKAVGWMLREVGKRSLKDEEKFLKKYSKKMPRTMLRYAIEKFPEGKRLKYLNSRSLRINSGSNPLND